MDGDSTVSRLKEEYTKRIPMLSINTLPDYALKQFIKMANEKFEGDRGMALTYLLTQGELVDADSIILLIQGLDERLRKLESPNDNSAGKAIRLASGRKIIIGGDKDG